MRPKALIITGYGLNCEDETARAFELAGAQPEKVHIGEIIRREKSLTDYQMLALIGGFCDGDHLGAGTVQANRFRHSLSDDIQEFIGKENDGLVIAICNGFQTAVKMGILPGLTADGPKHPDYTARTATLTTNDSGQFVDRWVYLKFNGSCIWTRNIDTMFLPVRHGEGKFFSQKKVSLYPELPDQPKEDLIEVLKKKGQIVCQYADPQFNPTMEYPFNPNGSLESIAGICDPTGAIFGLMPHPEAYHSPFNHPFWTKLKAQGELPKEGEGIKIFRNAVEYFE